MRADDTTNTHRDEPEWTTGQGIGFLASLSGWLLAAAALIGGLVTASESGGDEQFTAAFGLLAALGVVAAIPGTVVFHKCKRPQRDTGAAAVTAYAAAKGHDPQQDVILAAALELSHAIHRKRLQSGEKTVPRKFAAQYLTDELRERAKQRGVGDLTGRAVERAIKMGWLTSEGVGAYRVLSRTSNRLPDEGDTNESGAQPGPANQ